MCVTTHDDRPAATWPAAWLAATWAVAWLAATLGEAWYVDRVLVIWKHELCMSCPVFVCSFLLPGKVGVVPVECAIIVRTDYANIAPYYRRAGL